MVFSGHMIDQPTRESQRFPAEMEDTVRIRINDKIQAYNGGIGYAAAASGSDILFLEEMLKLGGEINIILPVGIDDFKEQSVLPGGEQWLNRFAQVMEQAASVKVLDQYTEESFYNSLEYCNYCMFGFARLRAEQIGADLFPLAVFDAAQPGGELGGTASVIEAWRRQQVQFSLILLSATTITECITSELLQDKPLDIPGYNEARHYLYLPMLHADINDYSKTSQERDICFSTNFLAVIAPIISEFKEHILWKQTTGGNLFILFRDINSAVDLARKLRATTQAENGSGHNSAAQQIRVVLDAGPCYSWHDPVMEQTQYCGYHVERAISMQPDTPPDTIYASDTFAALCRAFGIQNVSFDDAGDITMPEQQQHAIRAYLVR